MSLMNRLCNFLSSKLEKRTIYRRDGKLYLERYYILHNEDNSFLPGIYLHKFLASDEDPELHNHPWDHSFSLILSGGYTEEQRVGDTFSNKIEFNKFTSGMINVVNKDDFHRIELDQTPTWTLFFSGKRVADWGFWDQKTAEYLPWDEHLAKKELELLRPMGNNAVTSNNEVP